MTLALQVEPLAEVLRLAAQGWCLFPCVPKGKAPLLGSYRETLAAILNTSVDSSGGRQRRRLSSSNLVSISD
jgi:hypothetical protein